MVHLSMGVSDMKKFLINIAIFFAIVAVVDFSLGKVFHYLQARGGGRTGAEYYACKESNEDVIILGSSRAMHHYVPSIIEDSLEMSCYNAGQDGNGIIMQYGRWKMISERYAPKIVIYDVTPEFDLLENDNMAYIDRLKPFCNDVEVKQYVSSIFPFERLKLISNMYCFNYKFIEMLSDCFLSKNNNKGYFPEYGQVKLAAIEKLKKTKQTNPIKLDEVKLLYLESLARECKEQNVKLVFSVSPWLKGGIFSKGTFASVAEIAKRNGASFCYFNDGVLSSDENIFKDTYHLNDKGARLFTTDLIDKIF